MDDLFVDKKRVPRGIRNNNPLNIVFVPSNKWKGLSGSDGRFCTFIKPEFCYRAAEYLRIKWIRKSPDMTIQDFIFRWCPDDTSFSYLYSVCRLMSEGRVYSYTPFTMLSDVVDVSLLYKAMTVVENGYCPYDISIIRDGIKMLH